MALKDFFKFKSRAAQVQTVTGVNQEETAFWRELFNLDTSNAVTVTPSSSLKSATVYSVASRKASTLAALPMKIEVKAGSSRYMDTKHDQYLLLTRQPHPLYTAFMFWRTMYVNYDLMGDAYAKIHRNPTTGRPMMYEILASPDISVYTYDKAGITAKYYKNSKTNEVIWPENMIHISDLNLNGLKGMSKIHLHAASIGYDMSAALMGKAAVENGTFLGGILKTPKTLTIDQSKKLRESFADVYAGITKAGRVGVLDEGTEFMALNPSMPFADIAFIESRNFQKEDIAMIMNYPIEMLSPQKAQSANGMEQVMIHWVQSAVAPFATLVEQELTSKIFRSNEPNHQVKLELKGLLRGDIKTRAEWYKMRYETSSITPNEIRALEDEERIDHELADQLFVATNNYTPIKYVEAILANQLNNGKEN